MRKALLYFLSFLFFGTAIYSCTTPEQKEIKTDGYSIDVEISNTSMDSLYLFSLGTDGWNLVDSINGDSGKFHFSGTIEGANYLAIGNKTRSYSIRLFADNNPIKIVGNPILSICPAFSCNQASNLASACSSVKAPFVTPPAR